MGAGRREKGKEERSTAVSASRARTTGVIISNVPQQESNESCII
jgi:hypothetical protein